MEDSASPSRRRTLLWMLRGSGVALLGTVLYPITAYLKPPKPTGETVASVVVGKVDQFAPRSGTIFRFGNTPGILIRYQDGTFRAFSASCTHLECTVQYRDDMEMIWCACHNGKYDLNGRNVSGPPPRPLEEYAVVVKGGEVHVTKA